MPSSAQTARSEIENLTRRRKQDDRRTQGNQQQPKFDRRDEMPVHQMCACVHSANAMRLTCGGHPAGPIPARRSPGRPQVQPLVGLRVAV